MEEVTSPYFQIRAKMEQAEIVGTTMNNDTIDELEDKTISCTPNKLKRKGFTDGFSRSISELKINARGHVNLEYEEEEEEEPQESKQKKKEQPENWKEIYGLIEVMRKENPAPVDTMGCTELSDEEAPPAVRRYHSLISLMLSSQTKDQVTAKAMQNLKAHGLTIENIRKTDQTKIQELIYPVSFYVRKAQYIKEVAEVLHDQYNSDIPKSVEELMKLKGVGPKMAYLCMSCAWGITEGIGVDVHVHRISNRLGWVKTTTPEGTRKSLESWLPYEYWDPINGLLVGFGQTICSPVSPKCGICTVNQLCPSSSVGSKGSEDAEEKKEKKKKQTTRKKKQTTRKKKSRNST